MSATHANSGTNLTSLRLRLLENGYLPIPVTAPDYPPHRDLTSPGKAPFFRGWQKVSRDTIDATVVAKWTTGIRNHTNTGLITGELLGLDIDVPVEELAAQIQQLAISLLGTTPLVRIGNAPKILLCYRPEIIMKKMKTPELFLPDGTKVQVEAMGDGQQVVGFGIHPDTRNSYTWPGSDPTDVPLSQLPIVSEIPLRAFLAAAEVILRAAGGLTKKERNDLAAAAPKPIHSNGAASKPHTASISSGMTEKNAFFREVNKQALASIGMWFPIIFPKARQEQGTGAWRISAANLNRGLQEDVSMHPITGGRDFGTEKSCSPIDLVLQWVGSTTVQQAAFWLCDRMGVTPAALGWKEGKAKQQDKQQPSAAELEGFLLNEDGVALAFTKAYRGNLRYCHHAQHWFVWTGSIWQREETRLAFAWSRKICREAARELQPDDKLKHVLARASTASAVERFAQADRSFAVTAETWDRDPWLLGTPGGTVDLRTGTLREADRKDHITKSTAVTPAVGGVEHPLWTKFLNEATGNDTELNDFLQRFAGYCLTGDVTEEVLAFFYGEGGTGKGTFIGTIVSIMADYAVSVPIEVFTAGSRLNLEYYRAQMAGARLITASETEAGTTWAESQINEMTGNETPLSARHPYGKVFSFRPQFKIGLVGNHSPRLKGRSKAMERRLRIAPFKHKPTMPDTNLKKKLRGEFAAILRWAIDGCLAWQRRGLGNCAAIMAETGAYFEQQDSFGRWLEERCIVASTVSERPNKLLMDFLTWARDSGEPTVTSTEFRELIERTPSLRYARNTGIQWVRGIGLKAPEGYQDHRNGHDP